MTITFSQTARDVVTGALRDLGIVALSDQPEAEELEYAVDHLNLILKDLAAQGASPWSGIDGTVIFPANVAEVVLVPRPAEVSDASVMMTSGYGRIMKRWSEGEYSDLPNKAQIGYPVGYLIKNTPAGLSMRLWPVPNVQTTISYTYSRVLEDVAPTTDLDLPQVWGDAIRKMLKARLTAFGPASQITLAEAEIARNQLLDYSRPEQYGMGPLL